MGKKYSRPSANNTKPVVSQPTVRDLSSSMDDFDHHLDQQSDLLAGRVDHRDAQIGIHFMQKELLEKVSKNSAKTATKSYRLEKWRDMASYGLDFDYRQKIFKSQPKKQVGTQVEAIEFNSYAMVGLKNFYRHHREKFLDRLRKGPPCAYRWLAWKFMGRSIMGKMKGRYENLLVDGRHNEWLYVIDKDLHRTFPTHPYFSISQNGGIGQKALRNLLQAYAEAN